MEYVRMLPHYIAMLWWFWLLIVVVLALRSYRHEKTGDVTRAADGGTVVTRQSQWRMKIGWYGMISVVLFILSLVFLAQHR